MGGGGQSLTGNQDYSREGPSAPGGLVDQVNQGLHELELHDMLERERRLDPEGRYVPYRLLTREQADQWERSFHSDPGWRLNKGTSNTWSYSPLPEQETWSPANQQLKDAMEAVMEKVQRQIKPSQGGYSPRPIPMKREDGQRYFDPNRSGDQGVAQLMDVINRLGIS